MRKLFALVGANPLMSAAIGFGIFVFLLGALAIYLRHRDAQEQRHEQQLQKQGATTEQLENNREVINAVQDSRRPVTRNELDGMRSRWDRNRQNSQ